LLSVLPTSSGGAKRWKEEESGSGKRRRRGRKGDSQGEGVTRLIEVLTFLKSNQWKIYSA
jgi:hypothetical protein